MPLTWHAFMHGLERGGNAAVTTRDPVVGPDGLKRTSENPENPPERRPVGARRGGLRARESSEAAATPRPTNGLYTRVRGANKGTGSGAGPVNKGSAADVVNKGRVNKELCKEDLFANFRGPFGAITGNLGPPRPRQTS